MKTMKRFLSILAIMTILFCNLTYVFAKNDYVLYQNSIVMVHAQVEFNGSNSGLTFSKTGTGTGFAVGIPGKPVQYIATCNHVVNEQEGIYKVIVNSNTGEILSLEKMDDGTETGSITQKVDGIDVMVCVDYFKTKPTKLIALYSGSTNDQVSLTVAQVNETADMALCKISSEPTKKLSAMPLQFKNEVNPNTDIIVIGFPGMSTEINAELRLDGTDSTIKDGRIGKLQRTTSLFDEKTMIDTYQLTASTAKGMSGGPVISEETNSVVGMVAFSYIDSSQFKADDYAICIDYLKQLLDAEGVEYEVYGGSGLSPIIIVAAVILFAIIVVVVILLIKRKPATPAPAPVIPNNNAGINVDFQPENIAPTTTVSKKYLIGLSGYMENKKFGVEGRAVIGRDKNKCNVVYPINQPGVSGVHCEIKFENGVFVIKDCGSSYGTFLGNGTRIEPNVPTVLTSGSQFWVGSKDNLFEVKY